MYCLYFSLGNLIFALLGLTGELENKYKWRSFINWQRRHGSSTPWFCKNMRSSKRCVMWIVLKSYTQRHQKVFYTIPVFGHILEQLIRVSHRYPGILCFKPPPRCFQCLPKISNWYLRTYCIYRVLFQVLNIHEVPPCLKNYLVFRYLMPDLCYGNYSLWLILFNLAGHFCHAGEFKVDIHIARWNRLKY